VKPAVPLLMPLALPQRIIVAISGASGAIYGVRLLQMLRELDGVETHLTVSAAGLLNDVGAAIASGSFNAAAW
jgi:3-polyprenyl-4-hydroxybenzoate decarboxylase